MVSKLNRREFLLGSFPFFWRKRPFETLDGIRFQVIRKDKSLHHYLLIHGNEETAREVLVTHMHQAKGIAYLVTGHERNVTIASGQLDPNRMFSREGAEKSLRSLNPDWSPERLHKALHKLDHGRAKLVSRLFPPPDGRLVALHNNSQGYSVKDEVPSSDALSLKDADHPHEFFLCTDAGDFAILATSPYNVVFQRKMPNEDDGSLSRLAARRGVRYINLEVTLGEKAKQVEMLGWLEAHLR
ncbi:MAG TPA: hypothetical protein VFA81_12205 [Burkholderiales bacterium]|nr:hypothetical protein [Burkholderiales bacterium]